MLKFCEEELEASKLETVVRIKLDQNLNFEKHYVVKLLKH